MKIEKKDLLELDVDRVFKSHTVAEIQDVQKEVLLEIEKKREELRTTVGGRYRDLLKAADTIADMRSTSDTVVASINQITSLCQALQEKRLLGFKQPSELKRNLDHSDKLPKMLEIKLLLTFPEIIWSSIDNKNYTKAAQFYLLAAHVHLGLQVSRIAESYPLLATHWDTISCCRRVILQTARRELNSAQLFSKSVGDCLTCLLLLEISSLEDILDHYLSLRSDAFRCVLLSDEQPTVKEKLRAGALLVQHTLIVATHCFLGEEDKPGLIEKNIGDVTGPTAVTPYSILPASLLNDKFITAIIKDFRPSTPKPVVSLSAVLLRDRFEKWLDKVRQILHSEMANLLDLIPNLSGILGVRERVATLPSPPSWNIVEDVLGNSLNVYTALLEPYVTERTLRLVANVWNDAIQSVMADVAVIDEELVKSVQDSNSQSESNLRWYIWKDSDSDDVGLKAKGFTPKVVNVCKTLDQALEALLEDVDVFQAGVSDKTPLFNYLNTCSFDTIQRFTEDIKNSAADRDMAPNESCILLRARILMALSSMCPNLKKCLRQSDTKVNAEGKCWPEMVQALSDGSIAVWKTWKEFVRPQFKTLVSENLDSDVSVSTFLVSRPAFEVVSITEEAEEDKTITSELRVPSQPSFTLQQLLLKICWRLNAVAVHTLPRVIHNEVVGMICELIIEHYAALAAADTIVQTHVLQLLLDIRFITLLFLSSDSQTIAQHVCNRLEAIVDPFDLNVFYPYLQANIKKSALRLQGTFGVLVDYTEKLPVLNSLKVTPGPQTSSAGEEPNVLAMSNNIPWFPLLPISSGSGGRKKEGSPTKQTKRKEVKKESASSDLVRSAGAFFGAISGGWS